jgi:hypothetical protein
VPTLRLLAHYLRFSSDGSAVDTAIRHHSSTENTVSKVFWGDINLSVGQIGISQVSTPHSGTFELNVGQVGTSQISTSEVAMPEIGTSQVSILQIGVSQASLSQLSSSQVGSTQIALGHEDFPNRGIAQINPAQINAGQLVGLFNVQAGKISLSSSVTLKQLLNVDTSSNSHNFSLQNTTIPTWTEFLTGTTPFNLNIEILDRPTGQLAEANITHFDSNGRPASGTLTHLFHRRFANDTDANDLARSLVTIGKWWAMPTLREI